MPIDRDQITYRKAALDDMDVLVRFRTAFLEESSPAACAAEQGPAPEAVRAYFEETIPSGEFIAYLALYGDAAIGVGGMSTYALPPLGAHGERRVGYILNMYTTPEARRNGVGKRIVDLLIAEGRNRGLSCIHLRATEAGEPLYRRAGFCEPHLVELELKLA